MKKVTLIHCIENKETHNFEEEAKLYINSFIQNSPKLFETVDINILQPTSNDISENSIDFFLNLDIKFTRIPDLSVKQINNETNYTNVCVTCDYFSKNLDNEYMCWTDLDVIFTNEAGADFFKSTDKIVLTMYDVDNVFTKVDNKFKVNEYYNLYFKKHISKTFYIDNITTYTNTWFIYGTTSHKFWSEWKNLTYELLEITHNFHPENVTTDIESSCEEIAASLLCSKYPNWFIDIRDFFNINVLAFTEHGINNTLDLQCSGDTVFYHYNSPEGFKLNNFQNQSYKKKISKILIQNFKETELDKWGIKITDLLSMRL